MVVVTAGEECEPTFAALWTISDDDLAGFGADHEESELIRDVVRAYDVDLEVPVLVFSPRYESFRFVLEEFG